MLLRGFGGIWRARPNCILYDFFIDLFFKKASYSKELNKSSRNDLQQMSKQLVFRERKKILAKSWSGIANIM